MRRQTEQSPRNQTPLRKGAGWARVAVLLLFADTRALPNDNRATETPSEFARDNTPDRRIVISIPDMKLALIEDGRVLKIYPVAVGALSSPTPTGQMRIINKLLAPTYYHPGQIIRPGKSNPLGGRWLGLSKRGYGIHGTNVPSSVGTAASHGCIRMRKRDVEELFECVRVDDVVEIHAERDERWAQIFGGAVTAAPSAPPIQAGPQPSPIALASLAGQL